MRERHHTELSVGTPDRSGDRDLFEDASIGTAILSPDGQFLRVNAALCDIVGRDPASLLATTWASLTHPDDVSRSAWQLERLKKGEVDRVDFKKRYVRPDREIVAVRATCARAVINGEPVVFSQTRPSGTETYVADAHRPQFTPHLAQPEGVHHVANSR